MSATVQFIIGALLLSVAALAVLLWPLWRAPRKTETLDRRQANLEIFRDQLHDLVNDRQEGLLSETDFEQAKRELQRRLLEETDTPPMARTGGAGNGRRSAIVLGLLIPIAAAFFYLQLGNPQALDAPKTRDHMQAKELDAMLARLAERLKANPDDTKGWVILARSYKSLGRYAEAAEAFARGGELVNNEPSLLADYAEALAQKNGGQFDAKADALIAKALKLDPDEPQALFLAGASASDRKDFAAAVVHWERLLPQLEAGSEEAESLAATIAKTREVAGLKAKKIDRKDSGKSAPVANMGIDVEVAVSSQLAAKAKPDDTLYVFARPAEGSRMPLAVIRARVGDLPKSFHLDDSHSLPGGQKLSAAERIVLEARVTKAGMAQSVSGDLFGTIRNIKPGSKQRLVIDQVQP